MLSGLSKNWREIMKQVPNGQRKSVSLLTLLLPIILIGLVYWSIKNFLVGNIGTATFSAIAVLAILIIAFPVKWISNAISASKIGGLIKGEEVDKPIYQGKHFSFSLTHTKRPLWFTVLLYIVGWIIIVVVLILALRSGAISL
jgi:hypothetical protein